MQSSRIRELSAACGIGAAACVLGALGCGNAADGNGGTSTQASAARAIAVQRHVVAASRRTHLRVRTTPDASCDLSVDGAPVGDRAMRLVADGVGDVRFHFKPLAGKDVTSASLQCEAADGSRASYPIELRSTTGSDAEADDDGVPENAVLRPALEGDLGRYSDEEIAAHGLWPRPDAKAYPERYARWVKDATRPMLVIPPSRGRLGAIRAAATSIVARAPTGTAGGGLTSTNWSGCESSYPLPATGATYTSSPMVWAEGVFTVPTLGQDGTRDSSVATWVGMGGAWSIGSRIVCTGPGLTGCHVVKTYGTSPANTPLIQAGSWSTLNSFGFGGDQIFLEYWTATGGVAAEPQFSSNYLREGDTLSVIVWSVDALGHESWGGQFGKYQVVDESSSPPTVTTATIAQPSTQIPYMGEAVDWIVERPTIGGEVQDLATYGSVSFSGAYAGNGGSSLFTPSSTVTMNNANQAHDEYQDPDANTLSTGYIAVLVPPAPGTAKYFCDAVFDDNH